MNYLRRKLVDAPPGTLIRTVRGKGYMIPFETELMRVQSNRTAVDDAPQIAACRDDQQD